MSIRLSVFSNLNHRERSTIPRQTWTAWTQRIPQSSRCFLLSFSSHPRSFSQSGGRARPRGTWWPALQCHRSVLLAARPSAWHQAPRAPASTTSLLRPPCPRAPSPPGRQLGSRCHSLPPILKTASRRSFPSLSISTGALPYRLSLFLTLVLLSMLSDTPSSTPHSCLWVRTRISLPVASRRPSCFPLPNYSRCRPQSSPTREFPIPIPRALRNLNFTPITKLWQRLYNCYSS